MKDLTINHPDLGSNVLILSLSAFGNPKIYFNDRQVDRVKKTYSFSDSQGKSFDIKLKRNGFDPIPKVYINEEQIEIARPLKWYEYVWMGLPIILALQGGALGAIFGLFALKVNSSIFRSGRKSFEKYLFTLGVNIIVTVIFLILAVYIAQAVEAIK